MQAIEFEPGVGGFGEALAGKRIGFAAAVVGEARIPHRQWFRLDETLEVQVVDRCAGTCAVIGEGQAVRAGMGAQVPGPAMQFGREILRHLAQGLGNQQAVQLREREFVVQETCRLGSELAFPQDFLVEKGLVEMEARGVERTQQAVEFHSADARRAQRTNGVEEQMPRPGAAVLHRFQMIEADGEKLEKDLHVVGRLDECLAVPQPLREMAGELPVAGSQGGRELCPQLRVVGGVGQREDIDAEAAMVFQHGCEAIGEIPFQYRKRDEGRGQYRHAVWPWQIRIPHGAILPPWRVFGFFSYAADGFIGRRRPRHASRYPVYRG